MDQRKSDEKDKRCGALLTVEPFRVVLGGAQGRHVAQAPVDHWVTSREINHCGSIQLALFCDHGSGVVTRVVGTSGNTVHSV